VSFSDDAWARTAQLRTAIEQLAFLTELGDGTLAPAAFRHYLEQDALYLAGYARALALLAARAPDSASAAFWAQSAHTSAVVESALHEDLLTLLGSDRGAIEHSPTCLGYVSYLTATAATEPYPVGCAALLPCFWVYADTGARLAATARATPAHPYARWVATYDAPEFQESTRRARQLTDDAAQEAGPGLLAAMHRAFAVATRFELHFWRSAHEEETWPTG